MTEPEDYEQVARNLDQAAYTEANDLPSMRVWCIWDLGTNGKFYVRARTDTEAMDILFKEQSMGGHDLTRALTITETLVL